MAVSYVYKGRDRTGKLIEGTMDADNPSAVADRLRAQGYMPTSIQESKRTQASQSTRSVAPAKRISVVQLSLISRQLATMISAGLPLVQSLNVLSQQIDKPAIREVIVQVRRSVEGGETLSNAMRKHPGVFPSLFVSLVEAGEASGSLETVLSRSALFFEKEVTTRNKVKGALVYPLVLVGVAAIAITALMVFVLPTFISMFIGFKLELPWITHALYNFGLFVQRRWYVFFGIPAVAFVVFLRFIAGPGKPWWDAFTIRVPLFGSLIKKGATAQFSRTFGMLIQSGVPMLQILDLLERASSNTVVRRSIASARDSVKDGAGLGRPLRQSSVFPPMLANMVTIGEETGALDTMLYKVADFYDQEVDYAVKNLTTMIEPMIILVIGVFAGLIVAAVMIPLFRVVNAVL